jgi:phosphatidylinositol alpha-1,6-mannosyltransferase
MILFNTQNFLPDVGGTQLYVTGLADALVKRGHAIAVCCDATTRTTSAQIDAIRPYPIYRFGGVPLIRRPRKARAVAKRIAQGDVTAMITDTWKSLEFYRPASGNRPRILCLAHGSEFLVKAGSRKEGRMIESMAKADILAANSGFTADLLMPYTRDRTRVRLLRPGIEPPYGASRQYSHHKIDDGPRILTIARLEPRKGIDTTLRAVAALADAFPNIRYDIVGKGDDARRLHALAHELNIGELVHFHGYISESKKAELLSSADLFLLPNRRETGSVEGFGIVFLEAAAFGVPAIAGSDGGARDAVLDGKTGLVVDAQRNDQVVSAVSALLSNPARRERLGQAAHARFWNEFAWDAAISRFEEALLLKMSE